MQKFILAETSEIVEISHPYGDITSDKWVYRIVATIDKDGDVFIKYEAGIQINDEIEFEECEFFIDFNKQNFNVDELQKFMERISA
jgi:hypothetical protein